MSTALALRFVSLPRMGKKHAKPEPSWYAVRRAAQLRERKIARAYREASKKGRRAVQFGVFQESITNRLSSPSAMNSAIDVAVSLIEAPFKESLKRALTETLGAAGTAGMKFLRREGIRTAMRFLKTPVKSTFNVLNPEAQRWIREHAGENIQGISDASREAIRSILLDAYQRGLPNTNIISRIRSVIGLNQQQAQAVMGLADKIAANPGERVYAGDRAIRVPDSPTTDWIDGQLEGYADRLLNDRAKMIARTETIAAANEGQRQAWLQAEEQGLIDRTEVERVWIVTLDDRLCPICEALEGATAEVSGVFDSEDVGELSGPPAHPNCRCAQGLQRKES